MTNVKKIIVLVALMMLTATSVSAEEKDLPFDTLASTYTDRSTEMLALVRMKSDGALVFVVMSEGVQGVGLVPYSTSLYNFYLNKSDDGGYPPAIFGMMLPRQERGQADDDLGDWNDDLHLLPVYALFNVEGGQIVCEKPFYSAAGVNPTHFQATIQNPLHTRLIETFLTNMPRLHEVVQAQGLALP